MSSTPNSASQPMPIAGSWEDLLHRARSLAASQDDDAIPAYQKIIDRLASMPAERRMAGNRRLQQVLHDALLGLHVYYTIRGRYDEALAMMPQAGEAMVDEEDRTLWARRETRILLQKGDVDTAVAQMRALDSASERGLDELGPIAFAYVDAGRSADAVAILEELDARCAELAADAGRTEDQRRTDQALNAWLHALVELAVGNVEQGMVHADEALELADDYREDISLVYAALIRSGHDEAALRYIQRDQARPIRSGFWHGLALRHLGKEQEAEKKWQAVTQVDVTKSQDKSLFEYAMSHYALGDPDGTGLSVVLSILRQQEVASWVAGVLAGLGWALRGDMEVASDSMRLARNHLRSLARGHQLPAEQWYLCQEFLEPDKLQPLAEYFVTRAPAAAPDALVDPLEA